MINPERHFVSQHNFKLLDKYQRNYPSVQEAANQWISDMSTATFKDLPFCDKGWENKPLYPGIQESEQERLTGQRLMQAIRDGRVDIIPDRSDTGGVNIDDLCLTCVNFQPKGKQYLCRIDQLEWMFFEHFKRRPAHFK